MLPNALAFGFSEVQPDIEPLKVSSMKPFIDNANTIEESRH